MMSAATCFDAPHLFGAEMRLFDHLMASGFRNYQEFGLGGSTQRAASAGFAAMVAVDSDVDWVDAARRGPALARRIADGSASVLHADIGPVGAWGMPTDAATRPRWPAYWAVAWAEWARRKTLPDLVYVDGRFRVACCLSALLACDGDVSARAALRVLVHDFDDRRPQYRPILDHFSAVAREGSLVLLRARDGAGGAATFAAYLAHQFQPD